MRLSRAFAEALPALSLSPGARAVSSPRPRPRVPPLSLLHAMAAAAGAGAMDRALDASKKYQKKTPLEHVLLRPDTYVGSIEVRAAAAALVSRGVCAPAGLSFSRCCTGA